MKKDSKHLNENESEISELLEGLEELFGSISESQIFLGESEGYLVPYVPTPRKAIDKIVAALEKLLEERRGKRRQPVVYEPGCGRGTVASRAAPRLGAYYLCLELDKYNVKQAKKRCSNSRHLVEVVQGDLASFYARRIDVVYAYLLPEAIKVLEELLEPGTPILSLDYYGDIDPEEEIYIGKGTLYIIRVKES